MARKLKVKVDKNKKKNIDDLYAFYLNSLDDSTRRKLDKEMLSKIYKGIEHYNVRKFRYLAFDSLVVSITKLEEYLKEDVAFHKEVGVEKYLELSEKLAKEMAYDFNHEVLNKNILEVMSISFFKWVIQNERDVESIITDLTKDYLYKIEDSKIFIKEIIVKSREIDIEFIDNEELILVTLKNIEDSSLKYLEIRKVDYDFLQSIAKVLKVMNLILETIDIKEVDMEFMDKYKECIWNLKRITDYIYFKEILSVSYDSIPNSILKCFKKKEAA
ncbi:MAG: hypothetical protein ACRDDH_02650 [Cetobacterium sp.]|uniref:hypothetical protein n=1 Tax=Cetobacterium sp. TaxID=2071632 RepID=UPI003EE6DDE6